MVTKHRVAIAFAVLILAGLALFLVYAAGLLAPRTGEEGEIRLAALDIINSPTSRHFKRCGVADKLVECAFDLSPPEPQLATSWEQVGPARWRFTLRRGVRFHNGEELTSAHVKWLLQDYQARRPVQLAVPRMTVEPEGDHAFVVTTAKRGQPLPEYISQFMVLHPDSFDEEGHLTVPIGTGPFRVESVAWGKEMVLVAFLDHWRGEPAVPRVVISAVKSPQTRVLMLEGGDVDWIQSVPAQEAKNLRDAGFHVAPSRYLYNAFVLFNNGATPLDDVRVRRALSHALDREAIVAAVYEGFAEPTDTFFPDRVDYLEGAAARYPFDRDRALSLLAEAGWERGDDGALSKDGKALTLRLLALSEWPILRLTAEVVQSQFKQIGLACEITVEESGAWRRTKKSGNWDMAVQGRVPGWTGHPLGIFAADWHSRSPRNSGYDYGRYRNTEVDRLIDEARGAPDVEARNRALRELYATWSADAPLAMICHDLGREAFAVSPRLAGVEDEYTQIYSFPGVATTWKE